MCIRDRDYAKPGVTVQGEWTTFTFDAEKEDSCFVVLKDIQTPKEEKIAVPAEYCMGSVRSIAVADLHLEHLIYDFEINGKKVMDPCAHAIMGRQVWNDSSRSRQQYEVHGAFDVQEFDWGEDVCPEIPREQMIMYKPVSYTHLDVYKRQILYHERNAGDRFCGPADGTEVGF